MATELAKAYVQIVPSAKGIKGSLSKELDGEASSAGASSGKSFGNKMVSVVKTAIIAAGIGKFLASSISEGAELEQSLGGIETLFKNSADKVKKNAAEAYRTAGLSANEYMQLATSFSASLLKSLAGDTAKSADIADMAMTDMSDNINKMGSSMEDIKNAYQGFAKQNYTMLDNLKLGYGGTKTEMERLLADAQAITGIKYDINNLSDVYSAIHVIQGELGITGTTAKEAASTISGSMASMKAAFMNVMGQLAIGQNIAPAMQALADTVTTFLIDNLLPAVTNILGTLPEAVITFIGAAIPGFVAALHELLPQIHQAISDFMPDLISSVLALVDGITDLLPELLHVGIELITSLANGIASGLPKLLPMAVRCIMQLCTDLINQLPALLDAGLQLIIGLADGILLAIPVLIEQLPMLIDSIMQFLVDAIPQIIQAAITLVNMVVESLPTIIAALIDALPQIIESLVSGLVGCIGQLVAGAIQLVVLLVTHLPEIISGLIQAIPQIVRAIIDGFTAALPSFKEAGKTIMGAMKSGIEEIWEKIRTFFSESIPELINRIGEWFSELPGRVKEWLDDTLRRVSEWASGMDGKAEEAGRKFITAIINFVKTLPEKIRTWLHGTLVNVTSFVSDFAQKATQAGQSFLTNIISKVKQIPGQMLSIGKNIVTGIWNGISGAAGWLYNQVAGFARGIISGIKSALGIASPSKVMRDEVGQFISIGIAKGIEENAGAVSDAMYGIAKMAAGTKLHAEMEAELSGSYNRMTLRNTAMDRTEWNASAALESRLISLSDLITALTGLHVELNGEQVGEIVDGWQGERYLLREEGVI